MPRLHSNASAGRVRALLLPVLLASCDAGAHEPEPSNEVPDAGDEPGALESGRCEAMDDWGADFVRIGNEGQLLLDGEPFVPHGVNSYPLLQHVGDGRLDAVEDILAQAVALGRPLIRTPAFMDAGKHPARIRGEGGALREQGLVALDRVLFMAAEQGVRLILILTVKIRRSSPGSWSTRRAASAV